MQPTRDFSQRLWNQQISVAMSGWRWIWPYLAISILGYTWFDTFGYEFDGLYAAFSLFLWGLGFFLLLGLMKDGRAFRSGQMTGIGTYLGLSIVSGLAIALGILLFVLPGLYLAMRWIPAYPRALDSSNGITSALGWSWEKTRPHQQELVGAFAPVVGFYFAAISLIAIYELNWEAIDGVIYWLMVLGWNAALSLAVAWQTVLGVALYRELEGTGQEIAETFQ